MLVKNLKLYRTWRDEVMHLFKIKAYEFDRLRTKLINVKPKMVCFNLTSHL